MNAQEPLAPVVPQNPLRDQVCAHSEQLRVSCGDGFTENQCSNRGCCFNAQSAVTCAYPFVQPINPLTANLGLGGLPPLVNPGVAPGGAPIIGQGAVIGQQIQQQQGPNGALQNVNQGVAQGAIVIGQAGAPIAPAQQLPGAPATCAAAKPAAERVDCGQVGILQAECAAKGCCWGLLPVGQVGPVCYVA